MLVAIFVMLLPSALATGEITPSNLRMVGLFPFLAIPPAWGLHAVLSAVGGIRLGLAKTRRRRVLPAVLALGLLVVGAGRTGSIYARWAGSDALYRAADGEMALAAEALDVVLDDADAVTVYIASEH
ncbi:MAG: hypothetical protein MUF84_18280, partial [Anaerolineae bacterium]|nr:hypothetical protein [Anaerolineae bacterium]